VPEPTARGYKGFYFAPIGLTSFIDEKLQYSFTGGNAAYRSRVVVRPAAKVAAMVDPERVLFTFPDRGFSYDCRGCGACCRGLGIGLDAAGGEVDRLTAAYPALIPFLRRRGDTWTAFNPRDRCWFLDDRGLCRVETEHGRAAKPASCRLFPFNRIFRLGSWMVVDYNSVICPLRPGGEHPVGHAEVLADIAAVVDPAVVGTPLPAGDAEAEGRALVGRERGVAAACFAAAPAADLAAGFRVQAGPSGEDDAALAAIDRASSLVDRALQAMVGRGFSVPEAGTLAAALWLTPSLRFNQLYGPRPPAPRDQLVAALPFMWLAWLGFAAAGAELAGRSLGLQELTTLWSEQAPLTWLAARWDHPAELDPGPVELPAGDADRAAVRSFAQACVDNRGGSRRLAELAAPLLAGGPGERAARVKAAEPVLRALRYR